MHSYLLQILIVDIQRAQTKLNWIHLLHSHPTLIKNVSRFEKQEEMDA